MEINLFLERSISSISLFLKVSNPSSILLMSLCFKIKSLNSNCRTKYLKTDGINKNNIKKYIMLMFFLNIKVNINDSTIIVMK